MPGLGSGAKAQERVIDYMHNLKLKIEPFEADAHSSGNDSNDSSSEDSSHEGRRDGTCISQFRCETPGCAYTTTKQRYLVDHQRKAHQKPNKCSYDNCNYMTVYSGHMMRHQLSVHKKQRPFCCPHPGCILQGVSYSQRAHLTDHERAKHSPSADTQRPHKCIVSGCGFRGIRKSHLKRHCATKHAVLLGNLGMQLAAPAPAAISSSGSNGMQQHQQRVEAALTTDRSWMVAMPDQSHTGVQAWTTVDFATLVKSGAAGQGSTVWCADGLRAGRELTHLQGLVPASLRRRPAAPRMAPPGVPSDDSLNQLAFVCELAN